MRRIVYPKSLGELVFIAACGFASVLAVACCGCGAGPTVTVEGGQKHEVNVHHDDQNTHVWIHRDRRNKRNSAPAPK